MVVKEIRKNVAPPEGIRATPSGLAVVGVGLLDNLEANRILLTYLAILFVFLFLAVRLRSIIRAAALARAGADRGRGRVAVRVLRRASP